MNLVSKNPNFSVIVPCGCQASCKFCFWKNSKSLKESEYIKLLHTIIYKLPSDFSQCSITGAEPTLMKNLNILTKVLKSRFDKIVLSTNGYDLLTIPLKLINHINISRHHYDCEINSKIFGTTKITTNETIKNFSNEANKRGVDITLNCILDKDFSDINFVHKYIEYAKKLNINNVCFRKIHSNLKTLPIIKSLNTKVIDSYSCPVYKTQTMLIDGMKVLFKYSFLEPINRINKNEIYELIFQPDGNLTSDWKGNYKVNLQKNYKITTSNNTYNSSASTLGHC